MSQFQMLRLWKTFQLTPLRNLRLLEVVETEEVTSFAEIMPITRHLLLLKNEHFG
jgi:hypothetical protein